MQDLKGASCRNPSARLAIRPLIFLPFEIPGQMPLPHLERGQGPVPLVELLIMRINRDGTNRRQMMAGAFGRRLFRRTHFGNKDVGSNHGIHVPATPDIIPGSHLRHEEQCLIKLWFRDVFPLYFVFSLHLSSFIPFLHRDSLRSSPHPK